jgi:hypothetical protein
MTIRYIMILEIEKRKPTPISSVFFFFFGKGSNNFFSLFQQRKIVNDLLS